MRAGVFCGVESTSCETPNAVATEKIMRDEGYGLLGAHKEDHERLLDELREIMDAFEQSSEIDGLDLGQRLDSWFLLHFRTHDAKLHHALGDHP
jgi:hemerythrin